MGESTAISWCDHTFNAWGGCHKVSPACEHCYAWVASKRMPDMKGQWGPEGIGTRVVYSESYWQSLRRWDRQAKKAGVKAKVFCNSISDLFEDWSGAMLDTKGNHLGTWYGAWPWTTKGGPLEEQNRRLTMDDVRIRLFSEIKTSSNLIYLLLTKRPENVLPILARCRNTATGSGLIGWINDWLNGSPPANVWLGTTAENQEWADKRIPELLEIPNVCPWVSYEPALGQVDWMCIDRGPCVVESLTGVIVNRRTGCVVHEGRALKWIVCGGESGPKARPFDLAWARSTRDQCRAAGVPFFMKQMGQYPYDSTLRIDIDGPGSHVKAISLDHKSGADPSEWPEDLRVQEFPEGGAYQ